MSALLLGLPPHGSRQHREGRKFSAKRAVLSSDVVAYCIVPGLSSDVACRVAPPKTRIVPQKTPHYVLNPLQSPS